MPPQNDDLHTKELLEVAVPLPVHGLFTYRVPPELRNSVSAGKRVLVPFGGRRVTGYVMGFTGRTPKVARIKSILDILDEVPLFPQTMIPFFHWVANYYLHPLGEVIQTALPGGLTVAERSLSPTLPPLPN